MSIEVTVQDRCFEFDVTARGGLYTNSGRSVRIYYPYCDLDLIAEQADEIPGGISGKTLWVIWPWMGIGTTTWHPGLTEDLLAEEVIQFLLNN